MPKVVSSISKSKGRPVADITLRCVIDGESRSNSFKVSLPLTADVIDLMFAIKEKNSPEFDFIGAFRLNLWKVLIPLHNDDDDIKEEEVKEEEGGSRVCLDEIPKKEKKLIKRVSKKVSIIFGNHPDDNTIHVVVKRPPKGIASALFSNRTDLSVKSYRIDHSCYVLTFSFVSNCCINVARKREGDSKCI